MVLSGQGPGVRGQMASLKEGRNFDGRVHRSFASLRMTSCKTLADNFGGLGTDRPPPKAAELRSADSPSTALRAGLGGCPYMNLGGRRRPPLRELIALPPLLARRWP